MTLIVARRPFHSQEHFRIEKKVFSEASQKKGYVWLRERNCVRVCGCVGGWVRSEREKENWNDLILLMSKKVAEKRKRKKKKGLLSWQFLILYRKLMNLQLSASSSAIFYGLCQMKCVHVIIHSELPFWFVQGYWLIYFSLLITLRGFKVPNIICCSFLQVKIINEVGKTPPR